MQVVIPIWFYDFGSVMYIFAAIIGALLTYFSFKVHAYSRKRSHRLLYTGFMLATAGFALLAATNTYNLANFQECAPNCTISDETESTLFNTAGNYGYYALSLVGYLMFAMAYMKRRLKLGKIFPAVAGAVTIEFLIPGRDVFVLYPFETSFFQVFHLVSMLLLGYVVYKTAQGFVETRNSMSLLVVTGFSFILLYHVLMYALPFSATFFAAAHFSLLLGFISLLVMLVRVRESAGKKV